VLVDLIHGNFKDLVQAFWDLQGALAILFAPILKLIQWLRTQYFQYVYPWMHDITNLISVMRSILEAFRLLGFKWAAKLDADLQKIQSYITAVNIAIIGTLNKATTVLGLMIDPGMMIRRDAFGRTLWDSLGSLKKAAGYGSARPIMPDEHAQEKQMTGAVYGSAPLVTTSADGSVVYDPALLLVDQSITKQMQMLGIQH